MEKLLAPLEAATILGISYPTLKNWIHQGRVKSTKTFGGHHRIPESEIVRLTPRQPSHPQIETLRKYRGKISERNQLFGLVLEVKFDGLVAQVTLAIGKQCVTSIISADAAQELQLRPGVHAAALFKSTEVMVLRVCFRNRSNDFVRRIDPNGAALVQSGLAFHLPLVRSN